MYNTKKINEARQATSDYQNTIRRRLTKSYTPASPAAKVKSTNNAKDAKK